MNLGKSALVANLSYWGVTAQESYAHKNPGLLRLATSKSKNIILKGLNIHGVIDLELYARKYLPTKALAEPSVSVWCWIIWLYGMQTNSVPEVIVYALKCWEFMKNLDAVTHVVTHVFCIY